MFQYSSYSRAAWLHCLEVSLRNLIFDMDEIGENDCTFSVSMSDRLNSNFSAVLGDHVELKVFE